MTLWAVVLVLPSHRASFLTTTGLAAVLLVVPLAGTIGFTLRGRRRLAGGLALLAAVIALGLSAWRAYGGLSSGEWLTLIGLAVVSLQSAIGGVALLRS